MSNYKDILKKKADFLQYLYNEHQNTLSDEKKEELDTIIYNTYEIINGKIDNLGDVNRKKTIMTYNDKLDSAMRFLSNFEKDIEENDLDDDYSR